MAGYIGSKAVITSGVSASIDELNIIDGVTATTAELNILDGVTSTAAELNILDGVTSTTAELNILDGVTATATELNLIDGVTATTAELNILDGVTATAAEINLIDGGTARGTTAIVDADGVLVNDAGTMRMTTMATLATYMGTKVGAKTVVFPSDWSSPTNTYTSSGTWNKGSLADDDYVWIYLLGSGGGGGCYDGADVNGGDGGFATLLYGQASLFHGGAYVIGAAKAGNAGGSGTYPKTVANASTFTLSAANGSLLFSTAGDTDKTSDRVFEITAGSLDVIDNTGDDFTLVAQTQSGSLFSSSSALPNGIVYVYRSLGKEYNGSNRGVEHTLFGGGNGGGYKDGGTLTSLPGTSEFAGAGGAAAATGTNGSAPGGGGGGSKNTSNAGGTGAAGNVRDYHV